jgi:acyl carrier protein
VCETFLLDPEEALNEDTPFLETGILDSGGVLELISFIEETFNIVISDDEMIPDNLTSLEKLTKFIQSKVA